MKGHLNKCVNLFKKKLNINNKPFKEDHILMMLKCEAKKKKRLANNTKIHEWQKAFKLSVKLFSMSDDV